MSLVRLEISTDETRWGSSTKFERDLIAALVREAARLAEIHNVELRRIQKITPRGQA